MSTPDAVILRTTLQPGDIGEIVRLHGVIHATECGFGPTFEVYVAEPLCAFVRRDSPRERLWLAEREGRIVGSIAIVEASPDTAQLRWFLVTPEARRHGLGMKLVEEAIAFCKSRGYTSILLWTVDALKAAGRLYEKVGFVLVQEKPDSLGGVAVVEQRYEMSLT